MGMKTGYKWVQVYLMGSRYISHSFEEFATKQRKKNLKVSGNGSSFTGMSAILALTSYFCFVFYFSFLKYMKNMVEGKRKVFFTLLFFTLSLGQI